MKKLGKLAPKHDPRTFKLEKYLLPGLPQPPISYGWSEGVKHWGMMGNDKVGNCTAAEAGHHIMTWTHAVGNLTIPSDEDVLTFYSAVTGYDPCRTDAECNNPTDTGAAMLDVLKYFKNVGLGGHKIAAFASCNPQNTQHIKLGIEIFGGLSVGVFLPISAQGQTIWDIPKGQKLTGEWEPGSWGGHCVLITDYDYKYLRTVTWGDEKLMTWEWFMTYCDEAYAMISNDFLKGHVTPAGFDLINLQNDLNRLN